MDPEPSTVVAAGSRIAVVKQPDLEVAAVSQQQHSRAAPDLAQVALIAALNLALIAALNLALVDSALEAANIDARSSPTLLPLLLAAATVAITTMQI